ncbi:adenine-specific methyltransferase EcoRI family protein [Mycoplasma sp. E35C]|uniref:adenine-specific methyltransferase EcoRI family protein n=1 Tax=Mycoplasma sp. E35C TaxID=2801918 RepID=UPI0021081A94|nr:adenine-specific methyltransferase EcoRI family protein [Mycoplasma sp. E35C]
MSKMRGGGTYMLETFLNEKNELTTLKKPLQGDGDFRSQECLDLLKKCDFVITNPPFSLFREFVDILIKSKKKFIIIGNQNATSYKEIFKLLKNNKVWYGMTRPTEFITKYEISNGHIQPIETQKFGNILWFTNVDHSNRHIELVLYKKYTKQEYPKYDNYDAINVDKVKDIPIDYDGAIGVPITFLDKYNPDQFEILGCMSSTTVDEYSFGYPYVKGKKKYARIVIKKK